MVVPLQLGSMWFFKVDNLKQVAIIVQLLYPGDDCCSPMVNLRVNLH